MKRVLLCLIRFYRKQISPLLRPCCRFTPTCSRYAMEAVERFGAWKGFLLAAWRVLRCHPFSPGGYDPVPETFTFQRLSSRTRCGGDEPHTDSQLSHSSGDLSDPSDHPPAG